MSIIGNNPKNILYTDMGHLSGVYRCIVLMSEVGSTTGHRGR